LTINLIQDNATPHNNVLIGAFVGRSDVEIKLWYRQSQYLARYQWSRDLSHEHFSATIYGNRLNLSFLRYCIARRDERFVIVGWANINTRLLHMLFFLLRRPFNHWTDMPNPREEGRSLRQKVLRWVAYRLLWLSRCKVFGVGKPSIDLLRAWGFSDSRLVNLPIFVKTDEELEAYRAHAQDIRHRYNVPHDGFLLSAGSRLLFEKGYDLLIDAVALIPPTLRERTRLIIVGSGLESEALLKQIDSSGLTESVRLAGWMDIDEFKTLIANSDIFIHPARFDSYGGTTLGLALGVAVIGSTGAGAAVDRIEHGVNGFLYAPSDTEQLAEYISQLLQDPELRERFGKYARQTALQWQPSRGVDILLQHSI